MNFTLITTVHTGLSELIDDEDIIIVKYITDSNLVTTSSVTSSTTSSTEWTHKQLTGSFWWGHSDTGSITNSAGKVSSWEDQNQGIYNHSEYWFQSTNN